MQCLRNFKSFKIYFSLYVFCGREEFKDEREAVDVKTLDIRNFL